MRCLNCGLETKNLKFCSTKCRKEFVKKNIKKEEKKCVTCGKLISKNRKSIYCKECEEKHFLNKNYKRIIKLKAIEYKGGKCAICGYKHTLFALTFHHVNPKNKKFNISNFSKIDKRMKWETIKMELDKCILICNNCHCEINAELITNEDIAKKIGEKLFFKLFNAK